MEKINATVVNAKQVRLVWKYESVDTEAYQIERAPVEVFTDDQILRLKKDTSPLKMPAVGAIKKIGKFERITKESVIDRKLRTETDTGFVFVFTDTTIDLMKPTTVEGEAIYTHHFQDEQLDPAGKPYRFGVYAYRVRAVNWLGVESGPSPWVLTIPAAPENVFAQESGDQCKLKWTGDAQGGSRGLHGRPETERAGPTGNATHGRPQLTTRRSWTRRRRKRRNATGW